MGKFTRSLSTRLQLVYEQLVPGQEVWDVCCDHGYLGLKAHSSEQFPHIHFVDPATHLIEVLRQRCEGAEGISFYPVEAQAVNTSLRGNVVVAGVGAELICKIVFSLLEQSKLFAERLILVPHKHADQMQNWLEEHPHFTQLFCLSHRAEVAENGRLREVFVFQRT